MKVTVYPADHSGCGFYRMIAPARVLQAAGYNIDIIPPGDDREMRVYAEHALGGLPHPDDPITHIDNLPDTDIVVIQRPLRAQQVNLIRYLQARGYRVVVEIDDDFHALSPRNITTNHIHGDTHPRNLAAACMYADLVTVTTSALAQRYASHGRVSLLPNLIPAHYLTIEKPDHDGLIVGWSGSLDTHPNDLQQCGGAVNQVLTRTGATFVVIGTGHGVQAALGLREPPQATRWLTLDAYPYALAYLDVGIVPLEPGPFNEAKSALKGLEMASVGVPCVASPTTEYRRLVALGIGQTADHPRQWRQHLTRPLTNPDWRLEQAEHGRTVAATLTYEQHADRWWNAWARALDRRAA